MTYFPHCVMDGKKVLAYMYTMVNDLCFACSLYHHLEEGNTCET